MHKTTYQLEQEIAALELKLAESEARRVTMTDTAADALRLQADALKRNVALDSKVISLESQLTKALGQLAEVPKLKKVGEAQFMPKSNEAVTICDFYAVDVPFGTDIYVIDTAPAQEKQQ